MKWSDAVSIMAINSLYELRDDNVCRCRDSLEPCWTCKTHQAIMLAVKKRVFHVSLDIPDIARRPATEQEGTK